MSWLYRHRYVSAVVSKDPCQGQRTSECCLVGVRWQSPKKRQTSSARPRPVILSSHENTPQFSNIILVSFNRRRSYADAPSLPRNEKLLTDPVRLRQITERIPAARGPIIFLASRASQYVCGELLVVDGVRNFFFFRY